MKKMRVSGKVVTFYTISEVAKAAGKTPAAIRKLIERGILPEANFRSKSNVERDGVPVPGTRLYSAAIYDDLIAWLKSVKRGSKINDDMLHTVVLLFDQERSRIEKL